MLLNMWTLRVLLNCSEDTRVELVRDDGEHLGTGVLL